MRTAEQRTCTLLGLALIGYVSSLGEGTLGRCDGATAARVDARRNLQEVACT